MIAMSRDQDAAAFEPRLWLETLTKMGGGYALVADRRLAVLVENCDGTRLAHVMEQIVGRPERQDAIKSAIEHRQLGERP